MSRGARDVGKRRGPAVDAEPPRTGNGGAGGFHPTPSPTFTRSETATGGNGDERYGDERYGGASDVGTGGGDGGGASAGCGLCGPAVKRFQEGRRWWCCTFTLTPL